MTGSNDGLHSQPASMESPPTQGDRVVATVVLSCVVSLVLLFGERYCGAGWRSVWSFASTWLLLSIGLLPFAVSGSGGLPATALRGMAYGAAIGVAYALLNGAILGSVIFCVCVGNAVGYAFHQFGSGAGGSASGASYRVGAAVAVSVLALHLLGIVRPTPLVRAVGKQVSGDGSDRHIDREPAGVVAEATSASDGAERRFLTEEQMEGVCQHAQSLELGMPISEAISRLGLPCTSERQGGNWHFYVWAVDENEKRLCVTLGVGGETLKSIDWDAGFGFGEQAMINVLKKAQSLRRGMRRESVEALLGQPSSVKSIAIDIVKSVDPVTEEIEREEKVTTICTWSSAEDRDRFVMVGLDGDGVQDVRCNQPGRGTVYSLR